MNIEKLLDLLEKSTYATYISNVISDEVEKVMDSSDSLFENTHYIEYLSLDSRSNHDHTHHVYYSSMMLINPLDRRREMASFKKFFESTLFRN
jgi:hypothetical protein